MAYAPKLFFNGTPTANGVNTLYTVPTGKTAIITQWTFSPSNGQADGYLYLGSNFWGVLAYNLEPGKTVSGPFSANTSYMYQGFYVLNAGESLYWQGASGRYVNAYQVICGLEGTGSVAGRTPARLGTASSIVRLADTLLFTSTGNGTIIKTILAQNQSASSANFTIKLGSGTPIVPDNETCIGNEVKQYDLNIFVPAGDSIYVTTPTVSNLLGFAAYGWQL